MLGRDRGRRADIDHEIETVGGSIWTVREGKIKRIDFYPDRVHLLEAAGRNS